MISFTSWSNLTRSSSKGRGLGQFKSSRSCGPNIMNWICQCIMQKRISSLKQSKSTITPDVNELSILFFLNTATWTKISDIVLSWTITIWRWFLIKHFRQSNMYQAKLLCLNWANMNKDFTVFCSLSWDMITYHWVICNSMHHALLALQYNIGLFHFCT
jgi:hypothetical protein